MQSTVDELPEATMAARSITTASQQGLHALDHILRVHKHMCGGPQHLKQSQHGNDFARLS
eukprot:8909016-Alexandrium_andersonii.AAC.1